jgi:hypothetical protein
MTPHPTGLRIWSRRLASMQDTNPMLFNDSNLQPC